MTKKPLLETLTAQMMLDPRNDISLDNLLLKWGRIRYGQLSVMLAHLRFLSALHHQHHWIASGESSYSDHLLFSKIYTSINEEVDSLAERTIGLGGINNVDLLPQLHSICVIAKSNSDAATIPSTSRLAQVSLSAEYNFLNVHKTIRDQLDANGLLTVGLDDLLAEIASNHEEYVYLLRQRVL